MGNPFAIGALDAYKNYQSPEINSGNNIGAGKTGTGSVFGNPWSTEPISEPTGQGISKVGSGSQLQEELNYIGSLKNPTDFGNGLGGTNNPDDHKLFMVG